MGCESPARYSLIIVTCVVYVIAIAFNGLAAGGNGVFYNNTGDISDKYYLEITPAGWTFSIWGVIYTWQTLFLIYGLSTLCRRGVDGPLYTSPDIMPWTIYALFIIINILNVTWLFLFDRQEMPAGLAVIALLPFFLYISIGISAYAVDKNLSLLYTNQLSREAWLIRFLVQNALAIYAAWVTIATLLNLGIVLVYWGDFDQTDSCTGCLAVLCLDIVVYVTLDWFVLDRYIRYVFAPYIVLVVALSGSMDQNYVAGERNSVFLLVLLCLAGALFVVKMVLMLVRHFRTPLNKSIIFPSTLNEKAKEAHAEAI